MRPGNSWLPGLAVVSALLFANAAAAFDFEKVVAKARERAATPYEPPPEVPGFLKNLSYGDYQAIRFDPNASLWRESGSDFQVMMVPPGSLYSHTVTLNEIDADGVRSVPFDKSLFSFPNQELAKRVPADLGYSGFKLTYPLSAGDEQNQFLVFAGASYFRGVGAGDYFGLSARGLSIDTGLASGEEVPSFVEFWLERPSPDGERIRVYGLLDGPSLTGAYRFDIRPGSSTRINVKAELFYRDSVDQLGLAPLTSMFYYGENSPRPAGEWRPQVHDSDGLLVHDSESGEWLWRPLLNPQRLKLSYLQVNRLAGFGLMQRDTRFDQFEDAEARYDKRPSAWVSPDGGWSDGEVVLVEIPTKSETNDNIVAFWKPGEAIEEGGSRAFAYSLKFGSPDIAGEALGQARQTFVGDGNRPGGGSEEGAYRVVVDFKGGKLDGLGANAAVVSQVTEGSGRSDSVEIIEHFVEYVEADGSWRLSMLVRPQGEGEAVLRGRLALDDKPLTETWTYPVGPAYGIGAES